MSPTADLLPEKKRALLIPIRPEDLHRFRELRSDIDELCLKIDAAGRVEVDAEELLVDLKLEVYDILCVVYSPILIDVIKESVEPSKDPYANEPDGTTEEERADG